MTMSPAPDPKNVRDVLLEAGYTPAEVNRMLRAVPGQYIRATEARYAQETLMRYPEERPRILAGTWQRITLGIAEEAFRLGYIECEEKLDDDLITYSGTLWVPSK